MPQVLVWRAIQVRPPSLFRVNTFTRLACLHNANNNTTGIKTPHTNTKHKHGPHTDASRQDSSAPQTMRARRQPASGAITLLLVVLLQSTAHAARLPPQTAALMQQQQHRSSSSGRDEYVNERPIIGVLTQPGDPAPEGDSYIAASYIKWIEAAGARVVPIQYDLPNAELRRRFNAINGLLLPGGGANLSPGHLFYDTAASLFDMAIAANDKGDFFPVHGTCLGMEALAIIVSRNGSVLSDMDAENAPAPLLYTDQAAGSEWLRALPLHLVKNLQDTAIAMENHGHGLLTTAYEENAPLKEFFKVLSLSLDNKGLPYISMMEARKYPVYATQWHPEKNAFEWASFLRIPHSPEAIEATQETANFFVSQARKSRHAARDKNEEQNLLIYNWTPIYSGRKESGGQEEEQDFVQTYVFEGVRGRRRQQRRSLLQLARGVMQLLGWGK